MLQPKPVIVAVDTNILLDLALPRDVVHDAVDLMRARIGAGFVALALPTVLQELIDIAEDHGDASEKRLAAKAIDNMSAWGFKPVNYVPAGHGIIECIADKMRSKALLPAAERNDSLIVAEAALADCTMLLTSDSHLLGIDANQLTILLKGHDVGVPLIVSPSKIVRDFFPKKRP